MQLDDLDICVYSVGEFVRGRCGGCEGVLVTALLCVGGVCEGAGTHTQ